MKKNRAFPNWPKSAGCLLSALLLPPVQQIAQDCGGSVQNAATSRAPLTCKELATNPRGVLAGNPGVVAGSAKSVIIPASGTLEDNPVALCQMARLKLGAEHGSAIDYGGTSPAVCEALKQGK